MNLHDKIAYPYQQQTEFWLAGEQPIGSALYLVESHQAASC